MPLVEYCDNIHCRFNQERSCSATDVEFDENGICSTANYNETQKFNDPQSGSREDPGSNSDSLEDNEITDHELPSSGKDKDWVKYI